MIAEKFNGWFIGSILLGLLPAVVDLASGNIMAVAAKDSGAFR